MFGEVFICQFPFTSGATGKPRPVLVLFDLGLDLVICRITSATYSGPLDIPSRTGGKSVSPNPPSRASTVSSPPNAPP